MKRLLCILTSSLLAVSAPAFAWSLFPKDPPLTAITVSATATPAVTPLPAPTLNLQASAAPTPTPASSPLADKTAAKADAKPDTKAKAKSEEKKESLTAKPEHSEAVDFAPQKFDVWVPPPSDWAESLLDASGANALYTYLFDHQGRRKKSHHPIKVGTVYLPTTMLTTEAISDSGDFTLRRLSLQYVLVPRPNGVSQLKRYIKGFRVEFLISANHQNCIQIKDILPSTLFMNANFGGKLGVSTAVCMTNSGQFMPASSAQTEAGGAFVWTYQPKNLVIVSGAIGNSAFVEFEPKNDGTFYVGQVPIEISLLIPRDVNVADLRIVNTLITNEDKLLPLGEISSRVLIP